MAWIENTKDGRAVLKFERPDRMLRFAKYWDNLIFFRSVYEHREDLKEMSDIFWLTKCSINKSGKFKSANINGYIDVEKKINPFLYNYLNITVK